MIIINITGVEETKTMLNNLVNNQSSRKGVLTEISNLLVNTAKANAHVDTGNMKNNISATVGDKYATVTAAANYSVYENARSGTKWGTKHNFMDRAVESVIADLPNILSKWVGS